MSKAAIAPSWAVKVAPHPYSGERIAGEIVFDWDGEDNFIVEMKIEDVKPRENEGAEINVDHACCGMSFAGAVSMNLSLILTEAEAKQLHEVLGIALA